MPANGFGQKYGCIGGNREYMDGQVNEGHGKKQGEVLMALFEK